MDGGDQMAVSTGQIIVEPARGRTPTRNPVPLATERAETVGASPRPPETMAGGSGWRAGVRAPGKQVPATATMITSGGKRNPAKPERGGGTRRKQRRIATACPTLPSANATVPTRPASLRTTHRAYDPVCVTLTGTAAITEHARHPWGRVAWQ